MPVLPLVGSTMVVLGPIMPVFSAAAIIDTPIRSLTLRPGPKYSSLATTSALQSRVSLLIRTSGVPPTNSRTF